MDDDGDADGFGVLSTWRERDEFEVGEHVNVRCSTQFFSGEVLDVVHGTDVEHVDQDLVVVALTGLM